LIEENFDEYADTGDIPQHSWIRGRKSEYWYESALIMLKLNNGNRFKIKIEQIDDEN